MPAVSAISPSSVSPPQPSPWRSLVPYFFGGLAVMMGLIAVSLLGLAYSMWMHSGNDDRDFESRNRNNDGNSPPEVSVKKYLVIMAGEAKPTFVYPSSDDPDSVEISFGEIDNLAPGKCLASCILNFYIR
ncbi:hypothetical protein L1987_70330 [Smallanthus sonchifolius]|uniref:Uncharacterized protein n=1 Tax=Smallanthus sonchifolius TaxID=185202 RepID=A0ACB9ANZ6_9ASTR|nr:hypothetical protein L1987_70330 [Smallanthus sonchifolius]